MSELDLLQAVGATPDAIAQHAKETRLRLEAAGYDEAAITKYLTGNISPPDQAPEPFLRRFMNGTEVGNTLKDIAGGKGLGSVFRTIAAARKGFVEGFGTLDNIEGDHEVVNKGLEDLGVFGKPGDPSPIRFANEAIGNPLITAGDVLLRGLNAGVTAAGFAGSQILSETTEAKPTEEGAVAKAKRGGEELSTLFGIGAMLAGNEPIWTKPYIDPRTGELSDLKIGGLPTAEDFGNAAKGIGGPKAPYSVQEKLLTLYQEKGIHPSEVAADAANDVTITQKLLSDDPKDLPYSPIPTSENMTKIPPAAEDVTKTPEATVTSEIAATAEATSETAPIIEGVPTVVEGGGAGQPPEPPPGEILPPEAAGEGPKRIEAKPTIEVTPEQALADAKARIDAKINVGGASPSNRWSFARIYENVFDKLYGFQQAEKAATGTGKMIEETGESPTKLARLMAGVSDKVKMFLHDAPVDFHTFESNGKSLEQILNEAGEDISHPLVKGVTQQEVGQIQEQFAKAPRVDVQGFRQFIASVRTLELDKLGHKTEINVADAMKVVEAAPAKYKSSMMDLVRYQDSILRYLRESGVISRSGYAAMKEMHQFYIPFYKMIARESLDTEGGTSMLAFDPVKYISSAAGQIIDPLESIIKNTFAFIEAADRNVISTKMIDLLQEVEQAAPVGKTTPKVVDELMPGLEPAIQKLIGHNGGPTLDPEVLTNLAEAARPDLSGRVSIFRDGVKETYEIDPHLAEIMKGLHEETVNFLVRILSKPSSWVRAGSVLAPQFGPRFLIRDLSYSMATYSGPGFFNPIDTLRGLVGQIVKDEDFTKWNLGGGGGGALAGLDRKFMQESLDKLIGRPTITGRMWNTVLDPNSSLARKLIAAGNYASGASAINKFVIYPMRVMTELAMSANRLGAFKKVMRAMEKANASGKASMAEMMEAARSTDLTNPVEPGKVVGSVRGGPQNITKEQILSAAWISRETGIDPARIGASMKAANLISTFLNATIADPVRLVRALRDRPGQFLLVGGMMATASALSWALNHKDSRYEELPAWDKMTNFHILLSKWEEVPEFMTLGRPADQVRFSMGKTFVNNGADLRFPLAFAYGILFGTGTTALLSAFADHNPMKASDFAGAIIQSSMPQMIPTVALPALEAWANRNQYTGAPLVPAYLESQLPEYRYTQYTTEISKRLGAILGAVPGVRNTSLGSGAFSGVASTITNPIVIEQWVKDWTGTTGVYALKLADMALRKAGVLPDPPQPLGTLADIPVIGAFVSRYPSASAQSVQDFYEETGRRLTIYTTWQARMKDGDYDAAEKIRAFGGNEMFIRLDGMRKAISMQGVLIRSIWKDPRTTPEEKQQLIDATYWRMIWLAQNGNSILEGLK